MVFAGFCSTMAARKQKGFVNQVGQGRNGGL